MINHHEKDIEKRMYICITESVCCTAEINIVSQIKVNEINF